MLALVWYVHVAWHRHDVEDVPAAAERELWLWMAGTALLLGHVATTLSYPGSEVHARTGDTGGFEAWIILAGMAIAAFLLPKDDEQRDERDLAIANFGAKTGYMTLAILLAGLLSFLGFAPDGMTQRFTHWFLANMLLTLLMLACLVQTVTQLVCYWRDLRHMRTAP